MLAVVAEVDSQRIPVEYLNYQLDSTVNDWIINEQNYFHQRFIQCFYSKLRKKIVQ